MQSMHRVVARRAAWTIDWSVACAKATHKVPRQTRLRGEQNSPRDDALPPRALILASTSRVRKGEAGTSRVSKACGGGRGGKDVKRMLGARRGATHERRVLSPRHPQSQKSLACSQAENLSMTSANYLTTTTRPFFGVPPPQSPSVCVACMCYDAKSTRFHQVDQSQGIASRLLHTLLATPPLCLPISKASKRWGSVRGGERPWVGAVAAASRVALGPDTMSTACLVI